jgi:hypothetical protein
LNALVSLPGGALDADGIAALEAYKQKTKDPNYIRMFEMVLDANRKAAANP